MQKAGSVLSGVKPKRLRFIVSTSILIVFCFAQFIMESPTLNRLDGIGYDAKLVLLPPIPDSVANIQIVDIDERSLFEVERMPWRRDLYAELTRKLTQMGAIVIAFDVLFSEPQENPVKPVLEHFQRGNNFESKDAELLDSILEDFDYDLQFAHALSGNEVVLGTLLHHQSILRKGTLATSSIDQQPASDSEKITKYQGYASVIDVLAEKAAGQGFMNSVEDADGFVRRAALIARVNDKLVPSLAAEAFRIYSFADALEPVWQQQGGKQFLEGVKIGNSIVPTDNQGRVLVPFRGPAKTYPYTSAVDVLENNVDPAQFDQAIVFVGTSASGLADLRVTPVTINFPGVEIHATVFEALFTPEKLIYRPDWWQGALAIKLLVVVLIIVLVYPRLGPMAMSLTTLVMLTSIILLNLALWRFHYIDLPLVSALLLSLTLSIYFITSGFFAESQRRKRVKAIFDQYVPPAHIDRLLSEPKALSLEGEKKELTVLFSDIRSFTTISEAMAAHELKRWLNQFFSPITRVIFQHDGTIDKYVGDMVMAFWGAPLDDKAHANKSIKAAFEMLGVLHSLNQTFKANNQPQANIGIGINTGEMNVGDMGSDYRRSYTVIGDAVNLGSRLEGLTKYYGLSILVSEFTHAQASDYEFLLIDKVKVKGKLKPVTIYSPLPHSPSDTEKSNDDAFNQAVDCYFKQEFKMALAIFTQLADSFRYPALIQLYIDRTTHWQANPPEAEWDGSFTHTSK